MAAYWSGPLLVLGLLILQSPSWAVQGDDAPPPVFFFGDSILDVGNNNYLDTQAKVNVTPYGIDFPGGRPTGRFTNGLNIADFLAMEVGLKRSPPAFLSLVGRDFHKRVFQGVNFASGGSGILEKTGSIFGQNLPLSLQIFQFTTVYNNCTIRVGEAQAQAMLANSLFFISTGSNDIMQNFNPSNPPTSDQKDELVATLASTYKAHLQELYNIGARKFAILGLSKIGCIPSQRWQNETGGCMEELNDVALRFDNVMENVMCQLSSELSGMKYSFYVGFDVFLDGFAEMEIACCGSGKFNGEAPCSPKASSLCAERRDYYYWDAYHPTQTTARMVVDVMYNGSPQYVVPINFKQLWMS
ncbi:GDSL esterase/lipase At1g71691 [Amborella trichopoda]|uniref:SGNH hydrolase-type esterase domain-containing protein n=1 Tax=Amborella trichopoda TaxID=13333 RepID=W1NMS4_AMBTC|nr:GDSL esterase/lipase At1g71691 [Amborella trichopoda]ERM96594.1 hypothetical protein AMTR_s00001p00270860 [Amborella trichopoda]|eukprot:XP_006829178.1 GDSL esterase/lipase At1g71691 [Amborella trichopoda]